MEVLAELDLLGWEEAVKTALSSLKREESELAERRRELEGAKAMLMFDLKRQRAEASSRWRTVPPTVLGDRYMLLEILGRGGFSEVWRAVDLETVAEVAVKVHQLAAHWGEEKKRAYVRHALREYDIQKLLVHPNVVRLHAVIEIDGDAFATVLEYCPGGDLERLLKSVGGVLPEREARAIVMQVLAALRYMNGYTSPWGEEGPAGAAAAIGLVGASLGAGAGAGAGSSSGGDAAAETAAASAAAASSSAIAALGDADAAGGDAAGLDTTGLAGAGAGAAAGAAAAAAASAAAASRRKIIHYDLKPANILFDDFRSVKVTDFGLSKILDEGAHGPDASSMELTSQGAGTYWYLPPECFAMGGPVRISNKVDVWSVGVIFYQMLYGRRPFGEGQTQEQMLASGTMTQQTLAGPAFPPKPAVSAEAKNFIKRCLQPQPLHRPDVLTLCEDPYLRMKMKV